MNARTLLLLLLLLLPGTLLAQRRVLPLSELTARAAGQEAVRLRDAEHRQAALAADIAAAARLPRVDLTASYQHVSETGGIDFAIPGLGIPPRHISFGDGNVYDAALSVSVPLYMGNRLSTAVDVQRAGERVAALTLEGARIDVHNAIVTAYRRAQLAHGSLAIFDQQQRAIDQALAMRRAQLAEGQALAYDTLLLSTRLRQIAVERSAAASQYERVILQLMQATGLDTPFDVEPGTIASSPHEDAPVGDLLAIALDTRRDFRALTETEEIGRLGERMSRAALLPSITASAALRYGRPGVDQVTNDWMAYYTAGIRLEWNLWAWRADRNAVERSHLEIDKARLRRDQLQRQIRTQIGLLQNDLHDRTESIRLLEAQIVLERQRMALVQSRLREGLSTTTELVDAETSLTTALIRLEQAHMDHSLKLTELTAILGLEAQ